MLSILMSMAVCSTLLVSCGDDDEPFTVQMNSQDEDGEKEGNEEKEEGEQSEDDPEMNTTDAAVTGRVSEVGAFYARIGGVVNYNRFVPCSYDFTEIGVEVSTTKDFVQTKRFKATGIIERKFNVLVSPIASETMFYYRTYIIDDWNRLFGETYSFCTSKAVDDIAVTGQTEEIGLLYARVGGRVNLSDLKPIDGSARVGIEISKEEKFSSSGYDSKSQVDKTGNTSAISFRFTSLDPDTKYYYRTYVDVSTNLLSCRLYGETKSFTTKATNGSFVTTGEAEVRPSSAKISGKADLSGITGFKSTVGIDVSENSDFSNPKRLTTTETSKEFSCRFTGLHPTRWYYYRTFVKVDFGSEKKEYYGSTKTFTTKGYDSDYYVDLGLPSGTLWATCNVGADSPEEYGDLFAWGECTPKSSYGYDNYCYLWLTDQGVRKLTNYCSISSYGYNGYSDRRDELLLDDDAARVNWGKEWRMPRDGQFGELISHTTSEWTTLNGIKGYKLTSKVSGYVGNSIFLPAAWYRYDSSCSTDGWHGHYWSRTLYTSAPIYARSVYFDSRYIDTYDYEMRYIGLYVRPVRVSQ